MVDDKVTLVLIRGAFSIFELRHSTASSVEPKMFPTSITNHQFYPSFHLQLALPPEGVSIMPQALRGERFWAVLHEKIAADYSSVSTKTQAFSLSLLRMDAIRVKITMNLFLAEWFQILAGQGLQGD